MERFYKWIDGRNQSGVLGSSANQRQVPPPARLLTQHEILHEDQLPGRIAGSSLIQVEPYGRLMVTRDSVLVPMFRVIGRIAPVNDLTLRAFAADCVQHARRRIDVPQNLALPVDRALGVIRQNLQRSTCPNQHVLVREHLWRLAEKTTSRSASLLLEAAGDAAGDEAWAAARYASERALWAVAGGMPGQCINAGARDSERRWQNRRFVAYLYGCLPATPRSDRPSAGLAPRAARPYL